MTQEEIQQKAYEVYPLDLDRHMIIEGEPYDNNKEKREAYISGLIDSQPSLPSNLDEAAEAHRRKVFYGDPDYSRLLRQAFKAGAEWMAGQGCTVEIDEGYFINNPQHDRRKGKFHEYYSSTFGHSKKIVVTPGDNVVVQIRKKD